MDGALFLFRISAVDSYSPSHPRPARPFSFDYNQTKPLYVISEKAAGWLFCGIRFFAGCQGCHPLQETFIFSVGANCVRPSLQTVTFHLRTCNARPYRLGFTHKNSFVFVGIQANSASLRGKFASQKLPPPYRGLLNSAFCTLHSALIRALHALVFFAHSLAFLFFFVNKCLCLLLLYHIFDMI